MAAYKLKEDVTIQHIQKIKEDLEKIFAKDSHLTVTIEDDVEVDFAGVQLLYAVKTFWERNGKTVTVRFDGSKRMPDPVAISGFGELVKNENQ